MAVHPIHPYSLRFQHTRSPLTSSADLTASSVLLVPPSPSRLTSNHPPLPPFLVSMPPRPSLSSLISRPVGSRPSSRRGRFVLLRLSVGPFHSAGLPSSFEPFVASYLPLVPPPSAFIERPSLVDHPSVNILEFELATISMNSLSSEIQSLLSPLIGSSACVVVNDLPSPPDLQNWEWPIGWERRLGEPYQLGTVTSSMLAVLTLRCHYWDADDNEEIVWVNYQDKVLPPMSNFLYAAALSDRSDVPRFVLSMRLFGHELLI